MLHAYQDMVCHRTPLGVSCASHAVVVCLASSGKTAALSEADYGIVILSLCLIRAVKGVTVSCMGQLPNKQAPVHVQQEEECRRWCGVKLAELA